MDSKLDFHQTNKHFEQFSQLESASFVQGMLVGQYASTPDLTEAVWIKTLIDEGGIGSIKESFLMVLHAIHQQTIGALESTELDFELFIPEGEQVHADEKIYFLADWCEGFLYGIGLGKIEKPSKEVAEILSDFAEISMVEVPEITPETKQQIEEDLLELVEFVRMGAVLVFDELKPTAPQKIEIPAEMESAFLADLPENPTLH